MNNLSENLKKIRKDNNLSQEQLAEELGVSRQAISKWESGVAYPEMEKIIQLCNKFDLNIDDLLNKDIREIKREELSKKSINKSIESFLDFITNTINLFFNMNFKSKIKCIFEQFVIATILLIVGIFFELILRTAIISILSYFPYEIYIFIWNIINSIFILFFAIASIGIIIHIFKTRYLDYYKKIKESSSNLKNENKSNEEELSESVIRDENNKILFKKNENKIVIRDPKDSEYKFVHSIFKIFVLGLKFFALIILGISCIGLVGILTGFIASFIISKTGFFFIGLLLTFASTGIIDIIFILLLLNFIFNRKNDKKKMIWSFIISLITLGIGIGLIFTGGLKFDYIKYDKNNNELIYNKLSIEIKDNTYIEFGNNEIEYIEKDIENIEVEVKTNKLFSVNKQITQNGGVYFYTYNTSTKAILDEIINNLNKFKVAPIEDRIYDIKIYASKENITKLKNNYEKMIQK